MIPSFFIGMAVGVVVVLVAAAVAAAVALWSQNKVGADIREQLRSINGSLTSISLSLPRR